MKRIQANRKRALTLIVGALFPVATTQAFDVPVHAYLTKEELSPLRAFSENGQEMKFSENAITEINDANEAVDSRLGGSAALFKPERHFTNEEYGASTRRLINLRADVLQLVTRSEPDGSSAREKLGQALHTIQDFYSHSNWIERGNTDINHALGSETMPDPALASPHCPASPNTLGPNGGGTLTSAYFVQQVFTQILDPYYGCDTTAS